MDKKYILAIDQGTTSSRAIIFNLQGAPISMAQKEFRQIFPKPGLVEHNPLEIWQSQLAVINEAIKKSQISPKQIISIGITNQRETTIIWDKKNGLPIANAIVWQDRRTAEKCQQLINNGQSQNIRAKTGLEVDAYFSASKIEWLLDNVAGARKRAQNGELAFGTVDSWVLYNLTQGREHLSDVSNASRTMLWNIHSQNWDEELLKIFRVPLAMLPQVKSSCDNFGVTTLFGGEIPIGAMIGDQQSSSFGQACVIPGMVKNTYGTGCFITCNSGEKPQESKSRLLTTMGWKIHDEPANYLIEGSVFMGGAIVQWFRDSLGIINHANELEPLAQSVPDTAGVTLVPAFAGLGAPYWQPSARAIISGLSRGSTKAHIARAGIEAIAHQVCDILGAMQTDFGSPLTEIRVDGGASKNNLLMQMQANLAQVPVVRGTLTETTAFGAAALAGINAGVWQKSDIAKLYQVEVKFEPQISYLVAKRFRESWRQSVEQCLLHLSPQNG